MARVEKPMEQSPRATDAHPEFYPDLAAAGGLYPALLQVAADLGLELGTPVPVPDGATFDIQLRPPIHGRADLRISTSKVDRDFMLDNCESGVAHARGRTPDLAEVARAVAAWCAGADPRGLKAAAPFIELPLMAEAEATGSAELVVEVHWKLAREAWNRRAESALADGRAGAAISGTRALFDAAYAEPRFRRLYPVTSHFNLWFSLCTEHPFTHAGVMIEPRDEGGYWVWRQSHRADHEVFDDPHAAVARAAEFLPPDCGAAVFGTLDDPASETPSATP